MVPMLTRISAAPMMKYCGTSQNTLMGTAAVLFSRPSACTCRSLHPQSHISYLCYVLMSLRNRRCGMQGRDAHGVKNVKAAQQSIRMYNRVKHGMLGSQVESTQALMSGQVPIARLLDRQGGG